MPTAGTCSFSVHLNGEDASTGLTYGSRRAAPEPHPFHGNPRTEETGEHPAARLPCPSRRGRRGRKRRPAACGLWCGERGGHPASRRRCAAASRAVRHHRRRRRHLAGSRHEGLDRRLQSANPDATVNYDPTGSGARPRAVPGRRCRVRRLRLRARRRGARRRARSAAAAGTSSRCRCTSARSPWPSTSRASRPCSWRRRRSRRSSTGKITTWNDPAIAARRTRASSCRPRRSRR